MRHFLILFLFSALVLSCSSDDDKLANEGEPCTQDSNCVAGLICTDLVCSDDNNNGQTTTQTTQIEGSTLLVSVMAFDKKPESGLNPLVVQNLDQERLEFPIVILLDFMNIDLTAGTMVLRGGAGLKTDTAGEYTWDPDGDEKTDRGAGTIDADGKFNATIELFEFIATSKFETEIVKNTIPIRELQIDGVLASDNGVPESIKDAAIEGYITKEDGDNTFLTLTPGTQGIALTKIFKDENLNFIVATKTKVELGDPAADGWYLTGKISAENTTVVE